MIRVKFRPALSLNQSLLNMTYSPIHCCCCCHPQWPALFEFLLPSSSDRSMLRLMVFPVLRSKLAQCWLLEVKLPVNQIAKQPVAFPLSVASTPSRTLMRSSVVSEAFTSELGSNPTISHFFTGRPNQLDVSRQLNSHPNMCLGTKQMVSIPKSLWS